MKEKRRAREFRARGDSGEEVIVRGVQSARFRDVYHRFLRASWPAALGALVFAFLAVNAVFAAIYMNVGGVAGARPGSFFDAFAFSVETMATIGYGAMHPESPVAHVLVIVQAIVGLLSTALVTGLVFTKFSQSTARIVFSERLALAPMNGVPTLTFRVGNDRENRILEATVRVSLVCTEQTKEGSTFYRTYDLPLVRERSPALSRSSLRARPRHGSVVGRPVRAPHHASGAAQLLQLREARPHRPRVRAEPRFPFPMDKKGWILVDPNGAPCPVPM